MSTKNLARTVIEAGRGRWAVWARREYNARFRAETRARLVAAGDDDAFDDLTLPAPWKAHRFPDDKLGPAKRWLASQIGRPWDRVRGELFARFDTRTTAGRHIVFGHMLGWVDRGEVSFCRPLFRVNRHGILRRAPEGPRHISSWRREPLPRDPSELERWLDDRLVGTRGDVLFWFTRTALGGYRQHHRLTHDDAGLWRSLPEWFRNEHDPANRPLSRHTN
jgi:hypothetical protein